MSDTGFAGHYRMVCFQHKRQKFHILHENLIMISKLMDLFRKIPNYTKTAKECSSFKKIMLV